MNKLYKSTAVLSIAFVLMFGANIILAQAQDNNDNISNNATSTESNDIPEEIQTIINEDENVTADDLEIKEPALLPGNPFYFIKNIGRGLKSAITFNQTKRAELKLRFANERLMEIKKVAESNNDPKLLEKALNKYEQELEKIEKITEKIKEKNSERAEKFVDKFIDNQIKQQKLLDKIEKNVPEEVLRRIQENRQAALQVLSDITLAFISADRFQEKIEEEMENQDGSDFKNFKNLEILKELENKVPDAAKDAIRRAQENTLKRLYEKMENNDEMTKNLTVYVKNINGNLEKHLEIIDGLEITNELDDQNISEKIKNALEKAREINIERIKNKLERMETEMNEQIKTTGEASQNINIDDNGKPDIDTAEDIVIFQQSTQEQIKKAASMIEKAKTNFESAKNNSAISDKLNSVSILIKNAQTHLEKARTAYEKELFGEAFGQSSAATRNADNAIRIIARLETNKNSGDKDSDVKKDDTDNDENENTDKDTRDKTDDNDTAKNNDATTTINKEQLCAQVITPAKNQKTGECREFPTACIPREWYKVRACEKNQIDSTNTNSDFDTSSNVID